MTTKTSVWILAAVATAAIAGMTYALSQSRQTPDARSSSELSSPMPSPTNSVSPAPIASASPAATVTERSVSSGELTPAASPPLRQVESCVVQMAMVKDPNPPLNVRSGPSTSSQVISQVTNGTPVSVIAEQDGWFKIKSPVNGWVAKNRTDHTCNEKVEQLRLGAVNSTVDISDRFVGTGSHQYRVQGTKGQTLTITRQEGAFPVVTAPNGTVLVGDRPSDEQRDSWSLELPETGNYTLELVSNFRGYPYTFEVKLR